MENDSNSATLTLINPTIVIARTPVVNTNATIYGYPQYAVGGYRYT